MTVEGTPDPTPAGQTVPPPQAQVVPAPQTPPAPVTTTPGNAGAPPAGTGEKPLIIPQASMKRIKEEAREKGKKEALLEYAKSQGYESVEAMDKAVAKAKNGGGAGRASDRTQAAAGDRPSGHGNADKRSWDKFEKERQSWQREREQLTKRVRHESTNRRDLQRQLDAREAEMVLREKAVLAGIKDVNYAVNLLTRSLEGKSEDELKSFDEDKFYAGLRESHPYLFGEVVRPANTGTGAGGAPAAPKPGEAVKNEAKAGQVDAKTMKPDEFRNHLASRGLNLSM